MLVPIKKAVKDRIELCNWCLNPFDPVNLIKELVCSNCYKLLNRAGIKDEEIFSETLKKKV